MSDRCQSYIQLLTEKYDTDVSDAVDGYWYLVTELEPRVSTEHLKMLEQTFVLYWLLGGSSDDCNVRAPLRPRNLCVYWNLRLGGVSLSGFNTGITISANTISGNSIQVLVIDKNGNPFHQELRDGSQFDGEKQFGMGDAIDCAKFIRANFY